jgi:ubiquinol-cytochrome c reductase cytochrome b subunit
VISARVVRWLDDRLGTASFAKNALRKAFPDHWSFMIGEVALYSFLILIATGTFLTFFFDASSTPVVYRGAYTPLAGATISTAYDSALRISFQVHAGLLFRQVHHWTALVFLAAIVAHMARIFFTGAFRRPRELNWLIGTTLLILAIADGFTGYSLPDDLLSGTGVRIAYSALLSVPFVGGWAAFLFFGGAYPTTETLRRFFSLHILIVPGAIAGALVLHLAMIWRQKHTQFAGPGRTESNVVGSPLWPVYAMRSLSIGLVTAAIVVLLGGLVQINPIWLYGPYQAWVVSSPAQPDWYVGWADGALRLFPGVSPRVFGHPIPSPFWPLLIIGIFFICVYLWPFIERAVSKDGAEHHLLDRPWQSPWRATVGVAVLSATLVLTLAGSDDVQARYLHVAVEYLAWIYRIAFFVAPAVLGFATYWLCRELGAREREHLAGESPWETVRRTPQGGFEGERERV